MQSIQLPIWLLEFLEVQIEILILQFLSWKTSAEKLEIPEVYR